MTQALLSSQAEATNKRVLDILFDSDDISWKSLIFGLIQTEEMNPWDIDISVIAQKFIATLAQLKQLDFRISGKIIVASAILLKLKTDKLMDEEIAALDQLINSAEQEEVDLGFFDEFPVDYPVDGLAALKNNKPRLVPKTPQPRKRKVSVYDLVDALEKALETEARRPPRRPMAYKEVKVPVNHIDISAVIKEVYGRINAHYGEHPGRKEKLTFSEIIPSEHKLDKVMTFIPLLHLDNQRKIDILQEEHFGEIEIDLLVKDANLDEIAKVAEAETA